MLIDIVFKYKAYRALLGRVSTFSHKSLNIPDSKNIYIRMDYQMLLFGTIRHRHHQSLCGPFYIYIKLIYYYYSIFKKPRQQQRFALILIEAAALQLLIRRSEFVTHTHKIGFIHPADIPRWIFPPQQRESQNLLDFLILITKKKGLTLTHKSCRCCVYRAYSGSCIERDLQTCVQSENLYDDTSHPIPLLPPAAELWRFPVKWKIKYIPQV